MKREILDAIHSKLILKVWYAPGDRFVEPHALGFSRDGYLLLRAYQTSGASASGEQKNWKLFRLDRAVSIDLTEKSFPGARPDYRKGDKAMKGGIIAELLQLGKISGRCHMSARFKLGFSSPQAQ